MCLPIYLSNPNLNFIEVASLLDQESRLHRFSKVISKSSLKSIDIAVAQVLEHVFIVNPMVEAISSQVGQVIFRADLTYRMELNGMSRPFNPFTQYEEIIDGDVFCNELPLWHISRHRLNNLSPTLSFEQIPNPILLHFISDFFNNTLNEDQRWVARHEKHRTHAIQSFISLEKLVVNVLPALIPEYNAMMAEIGAERSEFINNFQITRSSFGDYVTTNHALAAYEIRGKQYEQSMLQDFWDKPEVQHELTTIYNKVYRVLVALFSTPRLVSELSLHPAFGYDVFYATVINGTDLVIKNLGDYRILYWELSQ